MKEAIAIVGIGCRFPHGINDPGKFWRLLIEGVDAITEVPRDRFDIDAYYHPLPGMPGKIVSRCGGFLDEVDTFDPDFFEMSPREANHLDPQQRLLAEVAWEAIEDAGIVLENADKNTGVFVGIYSNDYENRMLGDPDRVDLYTATGGSHYSAAGRLSYLFDLRGPSMVVETACASSLVAVHLACRSLRSGEIETAVAGGVNIILNPHASIAYSNGRMLSPEGKCRFGDAAADGFVRGEGCGMVVLKRLREAVRDKDRIYALILGSAVNNDGRIGSLVSPSVEGQISVQRKAYSDAGIKPERVSYVEAHGTGTRIGDPVEMKALGEVIGRSRPGKEACRVGSVKTNIGHAETASGAAGLIKTALSLYRLEIPPSLHFETPNPEIPWDEIHLEIPKEKALFSEADRPAIAGVNSFGLTGMNAHLVLREHTDRNRSGPGPGETKRFHLLPLSAKNMGSLGPLAAAWKDFLETENGERLQDICYSAAVRRTHHAHRIAVVGKSKAEIAGKLGTLHDPRKAAGGPGKEKLVFVFPGQGTEWSGMGRQLFREEKIYREMIERCDRLLGKHADGSLREEWTADASKSRIGRTRVAQPAIFALQMGLACLWDSWGIRPDAVVGHGLGEVAAACFSGILSLEDAVLTIFHRGRLLQGAAGKERMAAVEMKSFQDEMKRSVASISVRKGAVPIFSTVSGGPAMTNDFGPGYWAKNIRLPVRFAGACDALIRSGHTTFLEISPDPALERSIEECLKLRGETGRALPSLRRDRDERETMLETLGFFYAEGRAIDWENVLDRKGNLVSLPPYPWNRRRCWMQTDGDGTEAAPDLPISSSSGVSPPPFYRVEWSPAGSESRGNGRLPDRNGAWIVFSDGADFGRRVAGAIRDQGRRAVSVEPGERFSRIDENSIRIDAERYEDYAEALAAASRSGGPPAGAVYLRGLEAADGPDVEPAHLNGAARDLCLGAMHLAKALARAGEHPEGHRLWIVTRGAQPIEGGPGARYLVQSPLWGLGRAISLERPEILSGLIDLDPDEHPSSAAARLAREILDPGSEDQIGYRDGVRFVPRLVPADIAPAGPDAVSLRENATYLITGGLGKIGLLTAGWMAERGARHLTLLGRTGLGGKREIVESLRKKGVDVDIASQDVSDPAALARLFEDRRDSGRPVRGIVHAAGAISERRFDDVDGGDFEAAFKAKVGGSWALLREVRKAELDFLIFFSSASAVLGGKDLAHYAAANAFMDTLSHFARSAGVPALSIDWGVWSGGNGSPGIIRHFERIGMRSMPDPAALGALETLLHASSAQVLCAEFDWDRFLPIYGARRERPLMRRLAPPAAPAAGKDAQRFPEMPAGGSLLERRARVVSITRRIVAGLLGFDEADLTDTRKGFFQMGIDSITAVELQRKLEAEFHCTLSPTAAFEHPTIEALSDHIARLIFPEPETAPEEKPEAAELSEAELLSLLSERLLKQKF